MIYLNVRQLNNGYLTIILIMEDDAFGKLVVANKGLHLIKFIDVRCSRKSEAGGKTSSGDDCRVCRKSFGPEEISRTCCECQHKVCEDCASYSTTTNSDDPVGLHASIFN